MHDVLKVINIGHDVDLAVCRAVVDDAAHIVDFLNKVGGETDFLTFGLNDFPISVAQEKETILECQEKNICLMLIAKIDDEIVSQLFLDRSSKSRLAHIGDIGISVSQKHWGKSIGKHMMLTAIDWAKSNNITKLQLQVRADNDRAVQLYQKLGFSIEGKITRATRVNDIYFDDYIMGMQL